MKQRPSTIAIRKPHPYTVATALATVGAVAFAATHVAGRAPYLPDPSLTPGVSDPALTEAVVRAPGFTTTKYRSVDETEKRAVFQEYGIPWASRANYEVDHLVSLELGGSNDIKNLWPEPYDLSVGGRNYGAHSKDRIEDVLGRLVKEGLVPLSQAQQEIASDWAASYEARIGPLPPMK